MGKLHARPPTIPPLRAVPPPPLRKTPPLPPPMRPPPVVIVGPPLEPLPPIEPLPPLPSRPHLVSVPPLPAPPPPVEDPTTHDNAFAGALMPQSTLVKLFDRVGQAGAETKAIVVKLFERVRLVNQMRSAVAIERAQPATGLARFNQAQLNKYVVSTYKLIGFAVLTVIVLALLSYLGANVFYWFSTSWIEPTVVAPTDDRVLALSTQLLSQSSARDKVAADLADAERVMKMHEDFLDGARKALADELSDRKTELNRLMALDKSFASTRAEVASNGRAFTSMSKRQLAAEYRARFIDRESAVAGALQLSQLAQGNVSMAEKEIELYKRRAELQRETDALAAIVVGQPGKQSSRHSIEVLKIVQDVKRAEVELAKARDDHEVLQKSLERYDQMVKTLQESPFLKAVGGKGTIAFVPYDNVDRIKPDAPLYGCAIGPLFCKRVGKVVALLSGEMSFKHPLHNSQLRGQPVQVQLDDLKDAERKVLFVGSRPILF
jgi:hypothetical protein